MFPQVRVFRLEDPEFPTTLAVQAILYRLGRVIPPAGSQQHQHLKPDAEASTKRRHSPRSGQ
jgi:hypothetical protein